jgi:hypothetical protein
MTILTRKEIKKVEEYYYWVGYQSWVPFPEELKEKLLSIYGEEPLPYSWTKQDIYEGSRKLILDHFRNSSN